MENVYCNKKRKAVGFNMILCIAAGLRSLEPLDVCADVA